MNARRVTLFCFDYVDSGLGVYSRAYYPTRKSAPLSTIPDWRDKQMKIDKIDRMALRLVIDTALPALQAALAPFGVTVTPARSKFSNGSTGTLQFELVASGANPERESFEKYAMFFGLKPEDYGRLFTVNGERYKLVAIEPGRPKYPFVGERCISGGRFKFTTDAINRAFAKEPDARTAA